MRHFYTDHAVGIEAQKKKSFNLLVKSFAAAMYIRFIVVKGSIEDIWDLVANEVLLKNRLQTLAAKEVYTAKNLVDIALISCILWNGVDDQIEVVEQPPENPPV